jgi:hypothetical protein
MKRLNYKQLIVGLDQMFFNDMGGTAHIDTEMRARAIEVYLKASGWSWDEVIDHMIEDEDVDSLPN